MYHLALPAVSGAGIFYEQDKVGAKVGDILYWSDFMNSDIDLLTGNTSVLYFMSLQDLSKGPIIVHVPEGNLQGHADNIYQQVMTDWGIVGPNEGKEAVFLFLPPNYDGDISSNIAMIIVKQARKNPRDIANTIINNMDLENSYVKNVECAGPGFLNFYLNNDWLYDGLSEILKEKENAKKVYDATMASLKRIDYTRPHRINE